MGYSPHDCKELDTTEQACMHAQKKLFKKHEKWQRIKDQKMREVEDSQMSPNIYKAGIPKMGAKQMKQKVLY